MKRKQIISSLLFSMVLASPMAMADQQYPAADFQPEVVYQDKDYIANDAKTATEAPAINEADSKYPAANFEPKVLYNDTGYKHVESAKTITPVQSKPAPVVANDKNAGEGAVIVEEDKDSFSSIMVFALIAVAVVVLVLFRNKLTVGNKTAQQSSSTSAGGAGGAQKLTGVARYLNKVSGTGVSRYIEKQVKTSAPLTGVARYVAKQVTAAKQTETTQAVTGVEKYMRNRG